MQLNARFPLPYREVMKLSSGAGGAEALSYGLLEFLGISLLASFGVWRVIGSRGLDLVLHDVDVRGQGWAFEHVVRPHMRGYTPIAFVLTSLTHGEYGIGYQGPISELRLTEDGGVRTIVLGLPQRFIYEIAAAEAASSPKGKGQPPLLKIHTRQWVGGAIALDCTVIKNLVVRNFSEEEMAAGGAEEA
jgi:hypothetical protein